MSGRPGLPLDGTPVRSRTMRERVVRALTFAAALLALTLVALAAVWWFVLARPVNDVVSGEPVQIAVPSGASTADIADLLTDVGVVDNPLMFRLSSRLRGADGSLKPGVYDLSTGMSYGDVIDTLVEGPEAVYVTITIPEGFVLEQIAGRIAGETGVAEEELLELMRTGAAGFAGEHPYLTAAYGGSLEGYLFPKTYRVREGAGAADIVEMMLDQFDREFAGVDLTEATARGLTPHQVVTLASMIEREAKIAEERPVISSVIYNRLAKGMKLEIDATIEYVLPGNRFRLKASDLRIDSPYNTYRNAGLPPGPIASPGLASLEAAAHPSDTEYLYYVLTGTDGSHTFAATKEEFLEAKRKSKEVFGR